MTPASALVLLVHDLETALGNQAITETVLDDEFLVSGLAGGQGGDCAVGVACTSGADCTSGDCTGGVCQSP